MATSNTGIKTGIKTIHSRAPTRIDLAGGTVDIWPLYLFLKDPVTLNLGIDLYAEATIELLPQHEGIVCLQSQDQNTELKLSWKQLKEGIQPPPSLELHYKLLKFFFERKKNPENSDLVFRTQARSPAGAGLGGSSALSVAMIGALARWAELEIAPESAIEIVRDIETTVIQVPAGLQDYYGAMFGGLQNLHWGTGSHSRTSLDPLLIPELEKRLLLFYSGQSRNSGINNWALFKGFIDRQEDIRSRFQKITAATSKLHIALKNRHWGDIGTAIAEEWDVRKTLAPGITTPEIDQAFTQAKALAPVSGKVCGAGGGGCFFIYIPHPENAASEALTELRSSIQKIFVQQGMRSLDFHGVPNGLEVQVS